MAPAEHTVTGARAEMLAGIAPLEAVNVSIGAACGRTLADTVTATRAQPPFRSSAMDGYGIRAADLGEQPLVVRGEAAAGRPYAGAPLGHGDAVRIFTGAPVPAGVELVVPQERARRTGETVRFEEAPAPRSNIREAGVDFTAGAVLARRGVRLNARDIALLAASGTATVRVTQRPRVALLATGDELVRPGAAPGTYQIFDSLSFGLSAAVEEWGGEALPQEIRGDSEAEIAGAAIEALRHAALLVVVGGASVGDYDVVKRSLGAPGLAIAVERVAVRPGKPTWFGRLHGRPVLGLPGNPAAALVCAHLFLRPLLEALLGREPDASPVAAVLDGVVAPSGVNECYLRAVASPGADARLRVRPCDNQDTSLLSVFAAANALIRRPAGASGATRGDTVEMLLLEPPW